MIATVKNIKDGFVWHLVVIYGTAYNEYKVEFIAELHDILEDSSYPILLYGDFNLVRSADDKSTGVVNSHYTFLFNDWINRWGLMEIHISNRKFTWSKTRQTPFLLCWIGFLPLLLGITTSHYLHSWPCLERGAITPPGN